MRPTPRPSLLVRGRSAAGDASAAPGARRRAEKLRVVDDHHRSQGAHRSGRAATSSRWTPSRAAPEPPRSRGAPQPHGQGAAGRRWCERPRARRLGGRRRPGREQPEGDPGRARPHRRLAGHPGPRGAQDPRGPVHGRRPSPRQPALHARSRAWPRSSPRTSWRGSRASRPSIAPPSSETGEQFLARLDQAMARWTTTLEPFKGRQGRRRTTPVGLPPDAVRPRPGGHGRGAPGHPPDARAISPSSSRS